MKNTFLLAIANIKRRKLQSGLIAISIGLSLVLLLTAISVLFAIQEPFDRVYDELNASHILLHYDQQYTDIEKIKNWMLEQDEVKGINDCNTLVYQSRPLIFREKEIKKSLQIVERNACNLRQDKLLIYKGKKQDHPGPGEIWIPNHLAHSYSINIGDTLGVPTSTGLYQLRVSASVIDPHFASSIMNPSRVWVGKGELSMFFPAHRIQERILGIRLKGLNQIDEFWQRFNQAFTFEGNSFQYGLFKSAFLSFSSMIGSLLVIFSLLAIVISMTIVSTTLSSAMQEDFRKNGILKAIGFTSRNILEVYMDQYAFLFAIVLPLSLGLAYLLTEGILGTVVHSIGYIDLGNPFFKATGLSLSVYVPLLIGLISLKIRRSKSIKPIIAIRYGMQESAVHYPSKLETINQSKQPLLLALGFRQLFANKIRSLYTLLSLVFVIFIFIFSLHVVYSFTHIGKQKAIWGFEDADLHISLNQQVTVPLRHEDFLLMIQENPNVDRICPYSYLLGSILGSSEKAPQEIVGKIYQEEIDEMGLISLEGNHPKQGHEISLCFQTARDIGKTLGDSIQIFLEGQHKTYVITGIYQDISNLGQGFRLPKAAIKKLNPLFKPDYYAVRLKAGTDPKIIRNQLQKEYAETLFIESSIEERKEFRGIVASMTGALMGISAFFLLILSIVLFNDIHLNITEKRVEFGIYKALGALPVQLKQILIIKYILILLGSLCIGIPLAAHLGPILISLLGNDLGLEEFPFMANPYALYIIIPGMFTFIILMVYHVTGRLGKKLSLKLLST